MQFKRGPGQSSSKKRLIGGGCRTGAQARSPLALGSRRGHLLSSLALMATGACSRRQKRLAHADRYLDNLQPFRHQLFVSQHVFTYRGSVHGGARLSPGQSLSQLLA